jgi:hypothetical protein
VTEEANFIMNNVTQILHNAEGVNAPVAGAAASSVSLIMADVAKNPTTIIYSGGQLLVQEGSGAPVNLVASRVILSSFNFTNVSTSGNPATLKLVFNLSYKNTSGRNEGNYSGTYYNTATFRK